VQNKINKSINNIETAYRSNMTYISSSKEIQTNYEQKNGEDITEPIQIASDAEGLNIATHNLRKKKFNVAVYKLKQRRMRYARLVRSR